ncbi:hypothetical protein A2W54_03775 [Candidatus Giovannonibacteria bacterium RIFCSPHIGHO2_02_43_13]|uniref:Uncharacterized protein n=1 Tax=Candidatus Giovannonibacteria bacterium RIFCSPHIGHO2_02_43_13 TaxID=1798330 RepID=A0A1F5WRH1_9BACT|nr:MAG: Ribose-phosphate pyrophosphokinase [Parcubacteria group bacterium GW2011_GWA2_44_13]OGF74639.1 MAG: hypothetical protein A3E06_02885 [Candidatus Giovannonibacteria bacterium RIFCSPHIGHO2_12_FULL_44_42]OGF78194.1 MAG: hypothetical protein A2W54_03775 [Candidatus Giovannonibacteria bacterium RIFCSPHIGHO2_02_43_13]OGF90060.1 MAG: hypothetical protein A3I94_02990 [Candidatus Giovannonibacteria bacterium RIFCSPLOWO2_02_FULL_43_54]
MIIFSCKTMKQLADKIYAELCALSARRLNIEPRPRLGKINWDEFEKSWPNYSIENPEGTVRGKDVVFIMHMPAPEDVFKQLAVACAFPRYLAKSLKIVLPLFPTGTMERIQKSGGIATAKTLARELSQVPLTCTGPVELMMFDLHASVERFYFSDNILPDPQSALPILKERIRSMDGVAITFPDEGSYKRFGQEFEEYPMILCYKKRRGADRKVTIVEGDPAGKNVLIVDDLSLTAGTMVECAKAVRIFGPLSISGYVTHPVFHDDSWQKIINCGIFTKFWVTDSCPFTTNTVFDPFRINSSLFEVLSLAPTIAKILAS